MGYNTKLTITFAILIIVSVRVINATQCGVGSFFNQQASQCEACDSSCGSWCVESSQDQCLQCSDPLQYRDLDTWTCLDSCPQNTVPMLHNHPQFNTTQFRYCRTPQYYVDSQTQSNIELGTKDYPFSMVDDAFREWFNNVDESDLEVIVFLRSGTDHNLHSFEVPWVALNSHFTLKYELQLFTNLLLRPYSSDTQQLDLQTTVKIYHLGYQRPQVDYNPTLDDTGYPLPYYYDLKVGNGLMSVAQASLYKPKIYSFNSSIIVEGLTFIEETAEDNSINFLINSDLQYNTDLIVKDCRFFLQAGFYFAQTPWRAQIISNYFDMDRTIARFSLALGSVDCEKDPIDRVITWDNNTFTGGTAGAGESMIGFGYYLYQVKFINNKFINFQFFVQLQAIFYIAMQESCPYEVSSKQTIEIVNNTIENDVQNELANPFLLLSDAGPSYYKLKVIISNNKFARQTFGTGELNYINIFKSSLSGLYLEFNNNEFVSLRSTADIPAISYYGEKIGAFNNTFTGSETSTLLQITAIDGFINQVNLINHTVSASTSLKDSLLSLQHSQSMIVQNLAFEGLDFQTIRMLSVTNSTNITIIDVLANNCIMKKNHLIYISNSMDIQITKATFANISKTGQDQAFLIFFDEISVTQAEQTYLMDDVQLTQSQISFIKISEVSGLNESKVTMTISNFLLSDNIKSGTQPMFSTDSFIFQNFRMIIQNSMIINNTFGSGGMMNFLHNSEGITFLNCTFIRNRGALSFQRPFEVQNIDNPQILIIMDSTFEKNFADGDSLFQVNANSRLQMSECIFKDNYSIDRGSIISGEDQNSQAIITNTIFVQNKALQGGVFFSTNHFHIITSNCTFEDNFGIIGGVLYLQNDGKATFNNDRFFNNNAVEASLFYLINSHEKVEVSGCFINQNGDGVDTYIEQIKMNDTTLLSIDFISNALSSYSNLIQSSSVELRYSIRIVKATIMIQNQTSIRNQSMILSSQSLSMVEISDTVISDISSSPANMPLIAFEESEVTISGVELFKISSCLEVFSITSNTMIEINDMNYHDSSSQLLLVITSEIMIKNTIISDTTLRNSNLIQIKDSNVAIETLTMTQIEVSGDSAITALLKSQVSIERLSVNGFNATLISLSQSQLSLTSSNIHNGSNQVIRGLALDSLNSDVRFQNVKISNLRASSAAVIYFSTNTKKQDSYTLSISDSEFENNHATVNAGVMIINDSHLRLQSSTFANNSAQQDGGVIILGCQINKNCSHEIVNNSFTMNTAGMKGGAIFYDQKRPTMVGNNFTNNNAMYGKNYASYPWALKVMNSDMSWLSSFKSGDKLKESILIGIYDQDDQLIVTDSSSEAVIENDDITVSIIGNNKVICKKGIYEFKDLTLVGTQLSSHNLTVSSSAMNQAMIHSVDPLQQTSKHQHLTFKVWFYLLSSEIAKWEKPSRVNYALNAPRASFHTTPDCQLVASAQNTQLVKVDLTYMLTLVTGDHLMYHLTSTNAFWKKLVCGINSDCAEGYTGKLCASCQTESIDGKRYVRTGGSRCTVCQPLYVQILQIIGITILIVGYVLYILNTLTNNPRRNKPQTVMLRILTNYFQVVLLVKQFDLNWPSQVNAILNYFSIISSSQQDLFNFDCIILEFNLIQADSLYYFKAILIGLLPIILSVIGVILLILAKVTFKRKDSNFDLGIKSTTLTFIFIFLCSPQITATSFSLFNCFTYEDGNSYLRNDLSIECWTSSHNTLALSIGLSYIIVWTALFPFIIVLKLRSNKGSLDERSFLMQYGLFYVGLHSRVYYWEIIVVNFRKLVFIMLASLLKSSQNQVKSLLGIITLFSQVQYANKNNPYIDEGLNRIDFHASYASILTLYAGIFFMMREITDNESMLTVLFLLVLFYNVFFLTLWLYKFSVYFIHNNENLVQRYLPCLIFCVRKRGSNKKDKKDHNFVREENKLQLDQQFRLQSLQSPRQTHNNAAMSTMRNKTSQRHLLPRNKESTKSGDNVSPSQFKLKAVSTRNHNNQQRQDMRSVKVKVIENMDFESSMQRPLQINDGRQRDVKEVTLRMETID